MLRRGWLGLQVAGARHRHASSSGSISLRALDDILLVVQFERDRQQAATGVTLLPGRYTVPPDPSLPERLHGKTIHITGLRTLGNKGSLPTSFVEALTNAGFLWRPLEHRWALFISALRVHKHIYEHVLVRQDFVVPSDDPAWPIEMWGARLGTMVTKLRAEGDAKCPPARRAQLAELGFAWDAFAAKWELRIEALTIFRALYGHTLVPFIFVVPANDPAWPRRLWNYKLGSVVNYIRSGDAVIHSERRTQLNALGFVWDANKESFETKLRGFTCYRAMYGHLNISSTFTVPSDDAWPTDLAGKLSGTLTPERIAALDAIGFVWDGET
ncbi:hypothetical protein SPRG_09210 [Saprolegnia parasitica CBS 223.65]|uniref:Helicase-associated domain-containing protein n=1 Tax=Saprolegnia parasitica (strain CBS 223.65) TaxID=695850 RepID=A0A067CEU1_SAPPC|nr:hypothetical protein SPRG_09210 [Saprolegnia parasitica CBS 223.65]KDO25071.1 hypothetical protein SPRG_09210 [Saprolegnia parasitica CBS 223.65]|eukprot:XP_012204145.1 hypothetical protein SPRG_09210 [Saprolegnia parasitica CBS 223.65]